MSDSLNKEVGGSHYKNMPMQPVELSAMCRWDFFQGNLNKYTSRYKDKNGMEDLSKAIHYCELATDLLGYAPEGVPQHLAILKHYIKVNGLPDPHLALLIAVDTRDWSAAKRYIQDIMIGVDPTPANELELKDLDPDDLLVLSNILSPMEHISEISDLRDMCHVIYKLKTGIKK